MGGRTGSLGGRGWRLPDFSRMRSGQRAPLALPSLGSDFLHLEKVPGISAVLGLRWQASSSPKLLGVFTRLPWDKLLTNLYCPL